MKKRHFLAASALGAAAIPAALRAQQVAPNQAGPTLLTLSGLIGAGNRGALDPALDQMMAKQKIGFSAAVALDFAAITALPPTEIQPTLEYDGKPHKLRGPLLTTVARNAGAGGMGTRYMLRAVDGYAVVLSHEDAVKYRFIIATHLDGQPMPLGGLGPLWAVYDADRFPDMAARPLAERFPFCPWALYHIEVQKA